MKTRIACKTLPGTGVTPMGMYDLCEEKFGYATVAFDPGFGHYAPGDIIDVLWGALMGRPFRVLGRSSRKQWLLQAKATNEKWPGFITPAVIEESKSMRFFKAVKFEPSLSGLPRPAQSALNSKKP